MADLNKPVIVLTSGLVALMDEAEMRFVIGHELGHALSGHAVYQTLLRRLLVLTGVFNAVPGGALGIRAITAALMEWSRKAELSADRAGLLATQDTAAATRVHMKLASGGHLDELDTTSFFEQAAEYDETEDDFEDDPEDQFEAEDETEDQFEADTEGESEVDSEDQVEADGSDEVTPETLPFEDAEEEIAEDASPLAQDSEENQAWRP